MTESHHAWGSHLDKQTYQTVQMMKDHQRTIVSSVWELDTFILPAQLLHDFGRQSNILVYQLMDVSTEAQRTIEKSKSGGGGALALSVPLWRRICRRGCEIHNIRGVCSIRLIQVCLPISVYGWPALDAPRADMNVVVVSSKSRGQCQPELVE